VIELHDKISGKQTIRISVWNSVPAMVNSGVLQFENEINKLFKTKLTNVKNLEDSTLLPCDLLLCMAGFIEEEMFEVWIKGVEKRIPLQSAIKVPCIIMADLSASIQRELIQWGVSTNWYFDILSSEHITSLPVRVTNLLRFHDHLHEINRMQVTLNNLSNQVLTLQHQLEKTLSSKGLL
jgi:hypothetical protein